MAILIRDLCRPSLILLILVQIIFCVDCKHSSNLNYDKDVRILLENQSEGTGSTGTNEDEDARSPCTELVDWTNENCLVGPVSIREDVEEHVFHQLCPKPTGKFEAPSSCDLYVICHHDKLTVNRCPKFYHFNAVQQECVQAETYECAHPVGKQASSVLRDSSRDERFYQNVDAEQLQVESNDDGIQTIEERSSKGGHQGKCPESYISPHPYDCSQFQICSNGQIFNQKCGPGTLFNPLSKICDHTYNVNCNDRMTDYGTYDCQRGHAYITSHFEDCTKFIECFHGSLKIKSCAHDTVFNPEEEICDFKYNTECRKPISLEHDTDVNYVTRSRRKSSDVEKYACGDFNYIAPVEDSCNEFIECENGGLFRKTCGPGTAYNPLLGQCDWPFNVRSPDPKYCSTYLQCDGRRFLAKRCSAGTFYNAFNGKCEPSYKVDCKGKLDDPNYKEERVNKSK